MYHNLKKLLIAAAITSISACGATATATPATPPTAVVIERTVIVTAPPAPTPVPQVIVIEPTPQPELGKIVGPSGKVFGSIHIILRPSKTTEAFRVISNGATKFSFLGFNVCSGKLNAVKWQEQNGDLTIGAETPIYLATKNASLNTQCTWMQPLRLSDQGGREEIKYIWITVSVVSD